jgi:hypothetical protein
MPRRSLLAFGLLALVAAGPAPSDSFKARIGELTPAETAKMVGRSWHDGCPVPLGDLVSIHVTHLGYDGAVHDGVIVLHRRVAMEAVAIFHALFDAGFRIERMDPYEDFPIGAYAASNDSVGFYCRPAQDDPKSFSWHAYGIAIDLNPMTNPYHDPKEGWWPPGSAANSDRNRTAPGLVDARGKAVRAFMDHGWVWGGIDDREPDYMHFAKITLGEQSNPLERPVWADRLIDAPPKP